MCSGKLYIVPTPIGNVRDMTFRAVAVLQCVDVILAEDTRNSAVLLGHFSIETPMKSHHMHNEHRYTAHWVAQLKKGRHIALISDAGTPGISDPGFLLVRAAVENAIPVTCLPGATAFVPALILSGLPSDKFVFEGFLPAKKGRKTRLERLREETRTVVVYESPHKIGKTLWDLGTALGWERRISLSREISKKFEETLRGTIEEIFVKIKDRPIKGEITLIVDGKRRK
ncbi:MAG: 16S rRNA (cytidine(1402)-2'-O)-methyltransferase [Flavobacteriales bacterium]